MSGHARCARRSLPVALGVCAAFVASAAAATGQATAAPPDTANGSVVGTVRGTLQGRTEALPGALIQVRARQLERTTVADSLGRYRLDDLPTDMVRVRVSAIGYEPVTMDVLVPARSTVRLDVELPARPLALSPLEVTTLSLRHAGTPEGEATPATTVESAALEGGTGITNPGLVDVVRSLQGNNPTEPTDVLFMRGSTEDLKLVLLDGAPVYAPFHVAGLIPTFDPAVLGSAKLLVGAAPARYDGGLSYILDLRTREPGRHGVHGSGSADLLSASEEVDGPLGSKAGFLASARTLHDLGAPLVGGSSPYGYHDALLSTDAEIAPHQVVRAMGFWNRESVALDLARTTGISPGAAPSDAWWSNRAGSIRYHGRIGRALLEATAAASRYEASLPLRPTTPDTAQPSDVLVATGETNQTRLLAEVALPGPHGTTRAGLSYDGLDATYAARSVPSSLASVMRGRGSTAGAYVDVTHTLGSDLTLRAGLRADAFPGHAAGVRLAPRASLAWALSPDAIVTVAAGRYHQYAPVTDSAAYGAIGSGTGVSTSRPEPLQVATADHIVVSLDQTIRQRVHLGLDGFWKQYQGLEGTDGATVQNSGMDVNVRREGVRTTAWLGYQLSWFWSTNGFAAPTAAFVGRQLLTAGLSGQLLGPIGGDLRVAYGAGLPYTAVRYAEQPNALPGSVVAPVSQPVTTQSPVLSGGPDGNFLRVDVELRAALEAHWFGRSWQIVPYLRVLNALDRRDALFYAFSPYQDQALRPLAEQPLVPVVGVSWRF